MHHVIIGTGPAGVVAAESLRKLDPDAQITLLGGEPEPPYSRMAIPYLISGRIGEHGTWLRKGEDHFGALGIELRPDRVKRLDTESRSLTMEQGPDIGYDRLLIATGASPAPPPVDGVDLPGVRPCWTLADARDIIQRTSPGASVVLIGGGFIGCIILEALASRGVDLNVVEMEDRLVPRMMDAVSGNLIRQWCEDKGVRVHTSARVEAIDSANGGHPLAVRLEEGVTLPADLVITATGVRPNTGFLDGAGMRLNQGILVNDHLQTSEPDVYAAGDVAEARDFSTGGYSVLAIQPVAADQGRVAAGNMAGHGQSWQGSLAMNVLDTMGLTSASFGRWQGVDGGDSAHLMDADRYQYLNLQFEDDVLIGASALGHTDHIGVLRGLIQGRVRLGGWRARLLQDPTRLMEAWLASTQAIGFSAGNA